VQHNFKSGLLRWVHIAQSYRLKDLLYHHVEIIKHLTKACYFSRLPLSSFFCILSIFSLSYLQDLLHIEQKPFVLITVLWSSLIDIIDRDDGHTPDGGLQSRKEQHRKGHIPKNGI